MRRPAVSARRRSSWPSRAGVEIFATAGTPEKREFLRSLGNPARYGFSLGRFCRRDHARNGGEGIDLVLNSLTGEAIPEKPRAAAKGGRFLEIGKAEIWDGRRVSELNPNAAYYLVDLSKILMSDPGSLRPRCLFGSWRNCQTGALKPLPISEFRSRGRADRISLHGTGKAHWEGGIDAG